MENIRTKDAVSYATNIIENNIDKNKKVIETFMDFIKAFDTEP